MTIALQILSIILLFLPLGFELWDDYKGELRNQKFKDVIVRIVFAIVAADTGYFLIGKPVIDGVILSLSIHFFLFDYILHWLLIAGGIVEPKHGVTWWSYVGNTAVSDRWKFWRNLHPAVRFSIRLLVLLLASFIYFVEYSFIK